MPSLNTYEPIERLEPGHSAWPYAGHSIPSSDVLRHLPPVGIFIGILCQAKEAERRNTIRRSYHPSRWSEHQAGLAAIVPKFFIGRPGSAAKDEAIAAEIESE